MILNDVEMTMKYSEGNISSIRRTKPSETSNATGRVIRLSTELIEKGLYVMAVVAVQHNDTVYKYKVGTPYLPEYSKDTQYYTDNIFNIKVFSLMLTKSRYKKLPKKLQVNERISRERIK